WIERPPLGRCGRPAECAEGPEARARPGVQHIGVLGEDLPTALGTAVQGRRGCRALATRLALPDRDAVPPPQLAGDRPRPDVVEEVQNHLRPALVVKPHAAAADGRGGPGGHLLHVAEPLIADVRLDHRMAAVTRAHAGAIGFYFLDESQRLEILSHNLAGLEPVHPRVFPG